MENWAFKVLVALAVVALIYWFTRDQQNNDRDDK